MRKATILLIATTIACQARTPNVPVESAPADAAPVQVVNGILVKDGVLALRGRDTARASIVLQRSERWLRVMEIAPEPRTVTTDTIDASNLFVHSASAFDQKAPNVGGFALLVLRTGPSAGDPAVGLIGGSPAWRPIRPAENYPEMPPDPRAGCYAVERGEWDDPAIAAEPWWVPVPRDIRLHWQYAWHFGREKELIATDARGAVPGSETDMFVWTRESPEALRIVFSTGYVATSFRLRSDGANLVGTVTRSTDDAGGPVVTAPVVLRRIECPASGQ